MVDDRVELLLSKEENRVLLQGLEQASQRVERARAKRELAEIEKQEIEARIMKDYLKQLESRASEFAECQKEILEARLMVEEAERSLAEQNKVDSTKKESEVTDKDKDRLESVKAASITALIGVLAQLPISLTRAGSSPQATADSSTGNHLCQLCTLWINFPLCCQKRLGQFSSKIRDSCCLWLGQRPRCAGGWIPVGTGSKQHFVARF